MTDTTTEETTIGTVDLVARVTEIEESCEELRDETMDGWRVRTFDAWPLNPPRDRYGKSPVAFVIYAPDGEIVACSMSASDVVYSPGEPSDWRTLYSVCALVAHDRTHDSDENPIDPGWDADGLADTAAIWEETFPEGPIPPDVRDEIIAYLADLDRDPPFPLMVPCDSCGDTPMGDCKRCEGSGQMRNLEMLADDDPDAFAGMEIRLQWHGGEWSIHTGDPQYDQDHRGAWGSTVIPFVGDPDADPFDPVAVADELISDMEG